MRRRRLTPFRALFACVAVAQVAYGAAGRRPSERQTRALLGLMTATAAAEAAEARGRGRGLGLLAVAAGGGFAAELVGVTTGVPFGRYSYSGKLGPRVAGVPVLAAAAWMVMARPAWVTAGRVSTRVGVRVPLAAAALTAWDLFLEPRMTSEGYWRWERRGRYEGVPAENFAGWFLTALAIFAAWTRLDPDDAAAGDGALLLYVWTWCGETYANAALWDRRRTALVGGSAMGAIAVPALARSR